MGIHLRVNGIEVPKVKVRPKIIGGQPSLVERELVIDDPRLGSFTVDDNKNVPPGGSKFLLEYTHDRRSKWKSTTLVELLSIIIDNNSGSG